MVPGSWEDGHCDNLTFCGLKASEAKGLADGVLEALTALKENIPPSLTITFSLIGSVIGFFTTEREIAQFQVRRAEHAVGSKHLMIKT